MPQASSSTTCCASRLENTSRDQRQDCHQRPSLCYVKNIIVSKWAFFPPFGPRCERKHLKVCVLCFFQLKALPGCSLLGDMNPAIPIWSPALQILAGKGIPWESVDFHVPHGLKFCWAEDGEFRICLNFCRALLTFAIWWRPGLEVGEPHARTIHREVPILLGAWGSERICWPGWPSRGLGG